MKIQELYTLLFENYDQLESLFEEIANRSQFILGKPVYKDAVNLAFRLGFMDRNDSLVVAYKNMVRKNMLFSENPKAKDAGFWISSIKNARNELTMLTIFTNMVLDSLEEIQKRREEKEGKNEYKVLHKGSSWIMFKVEHEAAACKLGDGTKWCISARGERNYFNQYSQQNDIYMIHTRNEKFAILVDSGSREITEVQFSENEYDHPNSVIMEDFVRRLKEEGVDIDKVSKLIGTELVEVKIWIESFDLVEYGNAKEYNGWRITTYEPRYSMKDNTGRSWDTTIPGTLLGEIEDPKGETYYSWLNPDTSAGVKLWKVAAYNGEVKAPVDNAPLNRFIRMILDAFEEKDIDPNKLSIGYSAFITLNKEIKQGVR